VAQRGSELLDGWLDSGPFLAPIDKAAVRLKSIGMRTNGKVIACAVIALTVVALAVGAVSAQSVPPPFTPDQLAFFEGQVAPILMAKVGCI
jgi:hypothetical protein